MLGANKNTFTPAHLPQTEGGASVSLHAWLAQPVQSIVQKREIIVIEENEKPLDAFHKIISNGLVSAPVRGKGSQNFVGFLATRDLVDVTVLSQQMSKEDHKKFNVDTNQVTSLQFLHVLLSKDLTEQAKMPAGKSDDFNYDHGFTVQYMAKRNPFVPVSPTDPISKVLEILSRSDCHRVPVVDKDGNLLDIISQSRIVEELQANEGVRKAFDTQVLGTTKCMTTNVVSITEDQPALLAYQLMSKKNISGVAIVTHSGRLQGCVTPTDLKLYLQTPSFGMLDKSVSEFVKNVRQADVSTTKFPSVSVPQTASVAKVVAKLAATRMHRIFVTKGENSNNDADYVPVGVVSVTDICKLLLQLGKATGSNDEQKSAK